MQIVFSLILFTLCINLSAYFIGNALGIETIQNKAQDPQDMDTDFKTESDQYETGQGVDVSSIFGDFSQAIETFTGLLGGKYILTMIEKFCDECQGTIQYFTLPFMAIIGFLNVFGLIYLVSGRGTKGSD